MILDIISVCLLVCLFVVVLLLHRQMLKRFNAMGRIQQRIFKRVDSFLEKVQVQSIVQSDLLQPNGQDEELDVLDGSTGNWKTQFADGFVRYLKNHKSTLMDPAVFMGKDAGGYPDYIGFSIRRLKNLSRQDQGAFWLVASTAHDGKIYLKLHMNNRDYFNQLASEKNEIHYEFGSDLLWEDQGKPPLRIGVDLSVDPLDENKQEWTKHFKKMRENLEKLDKVFQHRVDEIFEDNTSLFNDEDETLF